MPAPAESTAPDLQRETRETLDRLLSGSNWRQDIEKYVRKNLRQKAKIEELEGQLKKAIEAAPKDGTKVLSKEQAEEFDAFTALKVPVKDLKVKLESLTKLEEKKQEKDELDSFVNAAKALGYGNKAALSRFLLRERLELDFRDVSVRNEDGVRSVEKFPFVRAKGDDKAQFVSLQDYLEQEVPELIPAFETAPETDDENDEGGDEGEEDENEMIDRVSREAAARARKVGGSGVRIAATRGRREAPAPSAQATKVLAQAEQEARNSGQYSI